MGWAFDLGPWRGAETVPSRSSFLALPRRGVNLESDRGCAHPLGVLAGRRAAEPWAGCTTSGLVQSVVLTAAATHGLMRHQRAEGEAPAPEGGGDRAVESHAGFGGGSPAARDPLRLHAGTVLHHRARWRRASVFDRLLPARALPRALPRAGAAWRAHTEALDAAGGRPGLSPSSAEGRLHPRGEVSRPFHGRDGDRHRALRQHAAP